MDTGEWDLSHLLLQLSYIFLVLTFQPSMTEITANDDGTFDVRKVFLLFPHHDDCGRFVRCKAHQADAEGNERFDTSDRRKLKVEFAPQPSLTKDTFGFQVHVVKQRISSSNPLDFLFPDRKFVPS